MLLGTFHAVSAELRYTDCRDICVAQNYELELNFYPLNTIDLETLTRASLLEQINREGLCTPSQTVYISSLHNWNFHQTLIAQGSVKRNFCLSQFKGTLR